MSETKNYNITGMTDGKADNVIAAYSIEGGAGNKETHYHDSNMSHTNVGAQNTAMHGGVATGQNTGVMTINNQTSGNIDRSITNTGTMMNALTGENNTGAVSAATSSPVQQPQQKALDDVTVDDVIAMLSANGLSDYKAMFREKGVDGTLFMKLTEDRLNKFGVEDEWERERILNLKKKLPKQ